MTMRRIMVTIAVVVVIVLLMPVSTHAKTIDKPTYPVVNAPIGVYFRNSPQAADTDRVPGHGVYDGNIIQLQCFAFGDTMDDPNNSLWYYAVNLTHSSVPSTGASNEGFLNAFYINDGLAADQVEPSVPRCDASSPIPEGASVFFKPAPSFWQNIGLQPLWPSTTADLTVRYQDWATGNNCTYNDSFSNPYNGTWVSILGGWSLSRLGPVYYLANATPEQVSHIHYILLIDPGSASDFGTCDSSQILGPNHMSAASALAMWLSQNQNNHLQIMAAERTASDAGTGLSQDYLSSIQSAGLMNQVTVCWNDTLSHEDAFVDYAVNAATSYMNSEQSISCQQN
jgi:hypothetical protein